LVSRAIRKSGSGCARKAAPRFQLICWRVALAAHPVGDVGEFFSQRTLDFRTDGRAGNRFAAEPAAHARGNDEENGRGDDGRAVRRRAHGRLLRVRF
jgi:hypothetical protein